MGTIVTFHPNIDYYYSRGLSLYESDNFIEAIKNYREAYRMAQSGANGDFRSVLEVEMACCYRNLNLLREAQLMYYKALSDNNPDTAFDSIIGLVDVFGTSGNDEALKYYMDMAAKRGFSRELDYIDAASQFFSQRDYRVEPTHEKNMLELGKKLMEAEQFDFARQLLEVVPPDSPSYSEACMSLAVLHNVHTGDGERALSYLEKVKTPSYPAEILVHTAIACKHAGKEEEYAAALDELSALDPDDITSLTHIVRAMAHLNDPDLVIKYGRKLAAVSPQRTAMLSYALALANRGELREARKILVMLQALYPYDAAVRVFSSLIARAGEKTDFSLTGELPAGAEDEMLARLNDVLAECGTDRDRLRASLHEGDLCTAVLMVFKAGSDNSKRILADIVAEVPYFERYIRDCLMDPSVPDADKRILLPVALKRLRRRPVYLTCRDICRPLFGKPPAKTVGKWRDIYCMAYGAIALFGFENFEDEFDDVFVRLRSLLSSERDPDESAAAALLSHLLDIVPPLSDDECCIELFGADKETYMAYKRIATGSGRSKKQSAGLRVKRKNSREEK